MSRRFPSRRSDHAAPTRTRGRSEQPATRSRREAPKRSPRVLKVTLVSAVVVTVLVLGGQWILQQPFFRVQHLTVTGNAHESTTQISSALGLHAHPSMISLSTAGLEKQMQSFPWVGSAVVTKHWPNTLSIVVHETYAVGVAKWQGSWVYVSATGSDLGGAPATVNLPTLTTSGPTSGWPYQSSAINAVAVASQIPASFGSQVRTISVTSSGSVTIALTTPVSFLLGDTSKLHAKFVAMASVIKSTTLHAGDVVDVTVPTELAVSGP